MPGLAQPLRTRGAAAGALPLVWGLFAVILAYGLVHGDAKYAFTAVLVVAAVAVGVASWRRSTTALLVYLPFSGVPTLLLYPHTALPLLAKDVLFVIPAYAGYLHEAAAGKLGRRTVVGFPLAAATTFAVVVVAQTLNPSLPNALVGAVGAKVWLLYVPMAVLGYHFVESRRDLRRALTVMSVAAVLPAALGVVEQLLIAGGKSALVYRFYGSAAAGVTQRYAVTDYLGGGSLHRIPSTFTFVTQYWSFTAVMVAIGYAWWRQRRLAAGTSGSRALVWALFICAGFLSGSRAAFLLVPLLIVAVLGLESPQRLYTRLHVILAPFAGLWIAVAALGAGVGVVVLFSVNAAVGEISALFFHDFARAAHLTLLGFGTGSDTIASGHVVTGGAAIATFGQNGFESWYVKAFVELGIGGLAALVVFLAAVVRAGRRSLARLTDPELRAAGAAIFALLLWVLVTNVKAQYMDLDPLNVYFWFLFGLLLRLPQIEADEQA